MIKKNTPLLIGAHISIAGGFEKAIERGVSIGCTTIQIFTKSNRQWHAKSITDEEAATFKATAIQLHITIIVAHATYLINLGSPDAATRSKSISAVVDELHRCEKLGITYLVLHPGSHLSTNEQECLTSVADSINAVLEKASGNTILLIENMAGQGSIVCYTFEQIKYVLDRCTFPERVGVCFDTAHAFAAGYDFRDKATYNAMWEHFDSTVGLSRLKVIHLNDSKKELGSRVDRHEDIGKGLIGLAGFKLLINDSRLAHIPKILETPQESLEDALRNIETVKSLVI
ncbi:MAG TPA: deoxyribonuclease IV [Candidatus Babeliales bacterium]|nr:deoxyribonuclease IV [Candidatus Babeliales bacterium]